MEGVGLLQVLRIACSILFKFLRCWVFRDRTYDSVGEANNCDRSVGGNRLAGPIHFVIRQEIHSMNSNNSGLRAEAEAIFGSAARGDADAISDRDILIVDDDCDVLRKRSVILKNDGFSVASYTFRKLQALAQHGALFLQHLKLEAVIISDRRG